MRFSVLINNYNYGRYLAKAIDSALGQTLPPAEVIVVDDGSTDDSRSVIERYGDRVTPVFKENGGQASCFNAGYAASSGDVICLLDADDYFLPEKLARLGDIYARGADIGWCFHSLARVDGAGRSVGEEVLKTSGRVDARRAVRFGFMNNPTPATTALTFRRAVLDRLLPMPSAPGVSVGDHYLKLGAVALSPGYMTHEQLAVQLVHDANRYTGKDDFALKATILTRTATALRDRVPHAAAFCDNLAGTSAALLTGPEPEVEKLLAAYRRDGSMLTPLRMGAWKFVKRLRGRRIGHAVVSAPAPTR